MENTNPEEELIPSSTPAPSSRKFLPVFRKGRVKINQATAGAGFMGLLGFLFLTTISVIFLITENYFISLLAISLALLVYVTGLEIGRLLVSSFTIFFSSRHLINKAVFLQEILFALKNSLQLKRDKKGDIQAGPLEAKSLIILPENVLSRDLQRLTQEERDFDYVEYIVHSYYEECHELYEQSTASLEFVANAMPLFGLIGTILGLITMFDSMGADVTIETLTPQLALAFKTTLYGALFSTIYKIISSRFDQRLRSLDYDYETLCRALQVIIQNKNRIDVS